MESRDGHDDDVNVRDGGTDKGGVASELVFVWTRFRQKDDPRPGGNVYATVSSGKAVRADIWELKLIDLGVMWIIGVTKQQR